MASDKHNIRKGKDILFADGEVREVRPLTIKPLRKFIKALDNLNQDATNFSDKDLDAMTEAVLVVLQHIEPSVKWTKDEVEDVYDLPTFGEIMSAAMGNNSPEV